MITPLDIRNATFPKGIRGYKEESVDRFLDVLVLDYEKVFEENQKLKEDNKKIYNEMESLKRNEKTVSETIDTAKSLMTDLSESADKRAEIIVKTAELDAERIKKEAQDNLDLLTEQYKVTKERLSIFLNRYRMFLESEIDRFNGLKGEFEEKEESL